MTDRPTPFAQRAVDADAEQLRASRHLVLRELLAGYADGELPPETMAQIDAHLVGCGECRREIGLHEAIRGRLAVERPAAPSPALRARISTALDAAVAANPAAAERVATGFDRGRGLLASIAVAGWLLAIGLAIDSGRSKPARVAPAWVADAVLTRPLTTPVRAIPLLNDMLDNFARIAESDLPGRARDLSAVRAAVGFPVEPLHAPAVHLLGAWTTELHGEPAAVLAYRLGDRLVVHYQVAEDAFFRHPAIRAALESRTLLAAADSGRSLVAWPGLETGSVLIGSMPTRELSGVWASERTR